MKRFLLVFMAVVMLLSFTACGNTAEGENTSGVQNTAEDKQGFYETYFTEENYKTAGKSVTLSNPDASISIVQDSNNDAMVEIKVLDNFFRLYQLSDGKQYVNTKITDEEGTTEDIWGVCEATSSEDILESMDMDKTALDMDFDSITKIQYLQTKDGVDVVQVYQKDPDYVEGTVTKEYCIKFVYNDTECQMIITSEIDPEGGEATDYNTDNVAEGFEVYDYTVDYENKLLVHWEDESKNIPFELVSENTITTGKDLCFDFSINEKTKVVTAIQTTMDEEQVTYTFFDVETCLEGVEIPSDAAPCDQEALGMMLLAVIFSGVEVE